MISWNHFPPKPACLAVTKNKIFRKIISYWSKFTPLTRKWFYTLIFTSNHFRVTQKRERARERTQKRERVRERMRAQPNADPANRREKERKHSLQSSHRHRSTSCRSCQAQPAKDRTQSPDRNPEPTLPFDFAGEPRALRLRHSTSTSNRTQTATFDFAPFNFTVRLQLRIAIEKWLGFDEFDRIWWFFFCWVLFRCLSIEKWDYIFVWQPRKCEKMWATSTKCVFYGIFKNITKHQKIFFEMQPNTWKHFPFQKIAFPKNEIFSGNAFTRTKRSLNILYKNI